MYMYFACRNSDCLRFSLRNAITSPHCVQTQTIRVAVIAHAVGISVGIKVEIAVVVESQLALKKCIGLFDNL